MTELGLDASSGPTKIVALMPNRCAVLPPVESVERSCVIGVDAPQNTIRSCRSGIISEAASSTRWVSSSLWR